MSGFEQKSGKKPKLEIDANLVRGKFIEGSLLFRWKNYILRCAINCDGAVRLRRSWPFVYAMDEYQSVNSALWDVSSGSPVLVAAWIFSPGGDETNLVYLEEHAENVFELHDLVRDGKFPLSEGCESYDVFSCSSGDEAVEAFSCPALEDISMEDLTIETVYDGEKHDRRGKFLPQEGEEDEEDDDDGEDEEDDEESGEDKNEVSKPPKSAVSSVPILSNSGSLRAFDPTAPTFLSSSKIPKRSADGALRRPDEECTSDAADLSAAGEASSASF